MKIALTVAMLALAALPSWASGPHKRHPTSPPAPDSQYIFALAAANKFLHAWQTDDLETGMILLSDRVRHAQDPEKVEQFFSGNRNRAFEIARGQGDRARYRFTVVLVTLPGTRLRRQFSDIVVVDAGRNDWVVDKLP